MSQDWSWKDIRNPLEDKLSVSEKVVDALLSGHVSGSCKCDDNFTLSTIELGPCTACFVGPPSDIMAVQSQTSRPIHDIGKTLGHCTDVFRPNYRSALQKGRAMLYSGAFVDEAMSGSTCPDGCQEINRPLCKAGRCVEVTCDEVKPFCNSSK